MNEEEVTTSSVASSANDCIDYLLWDKTPPSEGPLAGIELSDTKCFTDISRWGEELRLHSIFIVQLD